MSITGIYINKNKHLIKYNTILLLKNIKMLQKMLN